MKKILVFCVVSFLLLSGCTDNTVSDEQQKVYEGFKDSLLNNGELISNNVPFYYTIKVQESKGKYVYTVRIKEPRVAMTSIQMMILNPDDLSEDFLSNTVGIFDEGSQSMLPNQAHKETGYVSHVALQGVSRKKDFRVYAMVAYKDNNQLTQYQTFFSFNVVDGKNVKAGQ